MAIEPIELDYRIGTLACGECTGQGCRRCAGSGRVLDPAFDPDVVNPPEDRPPGLRPLIPDPRLGNTDMPVYSNLSDEDRIRLATRSRSGDRMLGPEERQRCATHPRRWETFRWTWPVPGEGETHQDMIESCSDAHIVRGCAACEAEDA